MSASDTDDFYIIPCKAKFNKSIAWTITFDKEQHVKLPYYKIDPTLRPLFRIVDKIVFLNILISILLWQLSLNNPVFHHLMDLHCCWVIMSFGIIVITEYAIHMGYPIH